MSDPKLRKKRACLNPGGGEASPPISTSGRPRNYEAARRIAYRCATDPEFAAWLHARDKHRYHNDQAYREAVRARCRDNARDYYRRHREAVLARKRDYYARHREEVLARKRDYYARNREAVLAQQREYRARKRACINANERARSKPGFLEAATGVGFIMRTEEAVSAALAERRPARRRG